MNIYKTEIIGECEVTISLDIDSEKQADVELARELMGVKPIVSPCEVCDPMKNPICTRECQDACPECEH